MRRNFPDLFLERMKMIIPKEYYDRVVKGFFSPRALSIRINTLKIGKGELLEALKKKNIIFKEVSWID
ncbi:MAG: hypothetical protein KAR31_02595, partial [Candidatus Omnitrophica bacterium]|nr:hypothetical protein [Candidatus Omnitrophota bacterium]